MKHQKNEKKIKEIKTKDKYKGELSPYNEWKDKKGDYNQQHEATDNVEANPDVLADTAALYYIFPCNDSRIESIKERWNELTNQQQQVLQMLGYEGRSLDNCAVKMGITKSGVQSILQQARKKIKTWYTKW